MTWWPIMWSERMMSYAERGSCLLNRPVSCIEVAAQFTRTDIDRDHTNHSQPSLRGGLFVNTGLGTRVTQSWHWYFREAATMQWFSIRVEAFSILCNAENLISGQALILNTLAAAACPKIQFATLWRKAIESAFRKCWYRNWGSLLETVRSFPNIRHLSGPAQPLSGRGE